MIPIIAKTERAILVNLVDLLKDNYPTNYQSWMTDSEVTRDNSHGLFPYTEEAMKQYMENIRKGDSLVWAIIVPRPERDFSEHCYGNWLAKDVAFSSHSPVHIGNITLQRINWIYRSAEMAIVIGEKAYWGKGYATETLTSLYNHGFDRMNLHRIWSGTAASNKGMIRVFEKLGMEHEGTFIHAMFLNGYWTDVVEYGILDHQWQETKGKHKGKELPKSSRSLIRYMCQETKGKHERKESVME